MIRSLPLAIAWRYLRAPTRNRFVSFIGLASVAGMVLGWPSPDLRTGAA